uniref:Uncharacterized protein n=1 Tax=Anopheles minimus TaxID=112268 RepID=A0A182WNJ0_9DIPT
MCIDWLPVRLNAIIGLPFCTDSRGAHHLLEFFSKGRKSATRARRAVEIGLPF